MDLVSDIVEHDPIPPQPFTTPTTTTTKFKSSSIRIPSSSSSSSGFPTANKRKPSQWRSRLSTKGISSISDAIKSDKRQPQPQSLPSTSNLNLQDDDRFYGDDDKFKKLDNLNYNEIHSENIELLSKMSHDEKQEAKNELLNSLNPNILNYLLNKKSSTTTNTSSELGIPTPIPIPIIEGPGTWIGGDKNNNNDLVFESDSESESTTTSSLSSSSNLKPALRKNSTSSINSTSDKKVRFNKEATIRYMNQQSTVSSPNQSPNLQYKKSKNDEEWEDIQDLNDDNNGESIHFPKPPPSSSASSSNSDKLDINDPDFNDKLHSKFYPNLPKNIKNLEWMKPITEKEESKLINLTYDSILKLRFNLNGDLINHMNVNDHIGKNELFHHSDDAAVPGYTISELSHFMKSTVPSQRSIGCKTIGLIMLKLNTINFKVENEDDDEDDTEVEDGWFQKQIWKLIYDLQILDLLNYLIDENKEKHLSVRTYATESLYYWKKIGGDEIFKKLKLKEEQKEKLIN